jgi:hypothetical protein
MFLASIRFWYKGWIDTLFIEPDFFFKYPGFHWVEALPETGLKTVFLFMIICSLAIALGYRYKAALIGFILSFSYFELLDASNYLNHHYLVVLFAFLLLFIPANRAFSLDLFFKRVEARDEVPYAYIFILCLQIAIVYSFAGIAKINSDWLLRAMPLQIWLREQSALPLIGSLLALPATAFVFSWFAMIYDCTIAWFLFMKKTRTWAFITVIIFHSLTALFFNIGVFPAIMILSNLIFFSPETHLKWYRKFKVFFRSDLHRRKSRVSMQYILAVYFILQIAIPLRSHFYPHSVFYSEEAYRFSWRVMLLEKAGIARFTIEDKESGKWMEVNNRRYLTEFQEKQMAIQPDFIHQFAQFLADEYSREGLEPIVRVDAHVTVNARTSEQLVDPAVNLISVENSIKPKPWILPERQE